MYLDYITFSFPSHSTQIALNTFFSRFISSSSPPSPFSSSSPPFYNSLSPVSAAYMRVGHLPMTKSTRKNDHLPQQPSIAHGSAARNWGLVSSGPIHAGMFHWFDFVMACAVSCCEFLGAAALSRPEDSVSKLSSLPFGSSILSSASSTIFPVPCRS